MPSRHKQWVINQLTDALKLSKPLGPNSVIGVVGGGQLGRMIAVAAARLGFSTIVLEPGARCPASQVCNSQITAAYDDEAALAELAEQCDVVTYEFENVPLTAAAYLETRVPLYPPSRALQVSQDRLTEKEFLVAAGIDVAPYKNVENLTELNSALAEFGGGILKTRRFGYDGKGQHVFNSGDLSDVPQLFASMGDGPFVLEKKINFTSEFSIIAARSIDGDVSTYDPSTNVHENGILRLSTAPASLSKAKHTKAADMTTALLNALDYVGVIGVEFFETDDDLLVNEFAPRVHNSGHWTREACTVSQFEQHVRAVSGHRLGDVTRHSDCEMQNLLGFEAQDISETLDDPNAYVTLYGKSEAREGRKMGHVTRLKRS